MVSHLSSRGSHPIQGTKGSPDLKGSVPAGFRSLSIFLESPLPRACPFVERATKTSCALGTTCVASLHDVHLEA